MRGFETRYLLHLENPACDKNDFVKFMYDFSLVIMKAIDDEDIEITRETKFNDIIQLIIWRRRINLRFSSKIRYIRFIPELP